MLAAPMLHRNYIGKGGAAESQQAGLTHSLGPTQVFYV